MEVELLNRQGVEVVGGTGDNRDSTNGSDSTPLTLPAGLPEARVREGESKKQTWERLRTEARAAGMRRQAAYDYATREVERLRPYIPPPPPEPEPPAVVEPDPPAPEPEPVPVEPDPPQPDPPAPALPTVASSGGVQGLGDLPDGWPTLPANASLQAEVGWVQGNRVLVVQGGRVDLSRSLSPAPSYAAIAWLETSILYPAKFADVTVKASTDQQDDKEDARREKLALVEIQTLLSEACAIA